MIKIYFSFWVLCFTLFISLIRHGHLNDGTAPAAQHFVYASIQHINIQNTSKRLIK